MLAKDYPYVSRVETCKYKSYLGMGTVSGYFSIIPKSAKELKYAIMRGPVSVLMYTNGHAYKFGKGNGIFSEPSCGVPNGHGGLKTDHAVLAVGYGTQNGQDYWLIKNSWGTSWGDHGYFKIATQETGPGICGIQQYNVLPFA